jgi:hypothetical protein
VPYLINSEMLLSQNETIVMKVICKFAKLKFSCN